ncbi:MAG: hypothetical protein JW718_06140 [Desulfovibrionaceae bacterium]|nr:hypothetical protein [Desulfovibrionaceae bacterium]
MKVKGKKAWLITRRLLTGTSIIKGEDKELLCIRPPRNSVNRIFPLARFMFHADDFKEQLELLFDNKSEPRVVVHDFKKLGFTIGHDFLIYARKVTMLGLSEEGGKLVLKWEDPDGEIKTLPL